MKVDYQYFDRASYCITIDMHRYKSSIKKKKKIKGTQTNSLNIFESYLQLGSLALQLKLLNLVRELLLQV